MPRGSSFKTVEAIGRTLPDVDVTTTWGQPTLKVRGKMFVCMAAHKSAEPNTLVVMMDFADRDALVEDDPGTYYLKEHYLNYRVFWSGCHASVPKRSGISSRAPIAS